MPITTIEETKKINVLTERVKKRKQECENATLQISGQRALSFTNSWKETGADPIHLRWAKAFARVLDESVVVIREGEIIVGGETKYPVGGEVTPEHNPHDLINALEKKRYRTMSEVMFATIEPDQEAAVGETARYWVDRSMRDVVNKAWRRRNGEEYAKLLGDGVRVFTDTVGIVAKSQTVFSPRVLKEGLNGIIQRAREEKEKTLSSIHYSSTLSPAVYHKVTILDCIIIACEAMIRFAKRHAELARRLAKKESDPVRKKELEKIAERCEWIPANPPRNFRETLQFYWFIHLGLRKESPFPSGPCPGRMDQWLYPFYEKDLMEGKLTPQEAAEILGCLWVKLNELQSVHGLFFEKEAAASLLQQVTLGGQTKDGKDTINELSYLILEVARQLKMPQPGIYIRWHTGIDHNFMVKAIETNRETQGGIPAFLNDQAAVRNFLAMGVDYEDAIEWCAAGCLSYTIPHCQLPVRMPLYINIPKVFEITLNNGIDPRTGLQAGIQTGDPAKFTCIEEHYEAFWKQYSYFIDKAIKDYYVGYGAKMERLGTPFTAALLDDCITKGLDVFEGGERYPQLAVCFGQRGCVDVTDSLAAIKKLVFDDKKLTMSELLDALARNWDGKEDIRQLCLQAPKYGNDNDYVDEIFNQVSLEANEIILSSPNPWSGKRWKVGRPALTGHYYYGEVVGALPNGRKAGTPLYDAALSPAGGADVNGPTALIKSATKVNHFQPEMDSLVLNMKFSPSVVQSQESVQKMLALLKTFFDRGGWHVQFNIISKEDLLEAQKHPEQWRHLIVRVAGYSAYFVDLPRAIQDEIIARTEHGL